MLKDWLAQVKEYAKESVELMLVGNKTDLGHQRRVRAEEGRQLAKVRIRTGTVEGELMSRERRIGEEGESGRGRKGLESGTLGRGGKRRIQEWVGPGEIHSFHHRICR